MILVALMANRQKAGCHFMRIEPAQPPYRPLIEDSLRRLMPARLAPLALFRVLARDERLFSRFMGGALLDPGNLNLRQREICILRTCSGLGSEYEWGVHVALYASKAGLL